MISLDAALWIVARALLGVFSSVGLAMVTWVISQLFLRDLSVASGGYFLTQALVIGAPAGIGAVAAWWNPNAPASLRLLQAALIPLAAAFGAWLVIEVRGVETYYALFGGSQRIPVVVQGDMLGTLVASSVIIGNAIGAALHIYRVVRYRDM